jgi:hypothetical protein
VPEHVSLADGCELVVGKPLERPKLRWKNVIKIDHEKNGCHD